MTLLGTQEILMIGTEIRQTQAMIHQLELSLPERVSDAG
jgi:hypothetical protein